MIGHGVFLLWRCSGLQRKRQQWVTALVLRLLLCTAAADDCVCVCVCVCVRVCVLCGCAAPVPCFGACKGNLLDPCKRST